MGSKERKFKDRRARKRRNRDMQEKQGRGKVLEISGCVRWGENWGPVDRAAWSPDFHTCDTPRWYRDAVLKCRDCDCEFLFFAQKQKHWYEVEKRPVAKQPVRCEEHHREWARAQSAKERHDRAIEAAKVSPNDETALMEAALSIVDLHRKTGRGQLENAVHFLRQLDEETAQVRDAMAYCRQNLSKPAS